VKLSIVAIKTADALMADDNLKNLPPNPNFQESVAELKTSTHIVETQ
jgi:hypothetical protein